MFAAIGLVVIVVMVFGGFAITGGNLMAVLGAIPHEMLIIGGAGIGSLLIGNSLPGIKAIGGGIMRAVKGPVYQRQDYLQAIFLTSKLMKMLRVEGPVALEQHVEEPQDSDLWKLYPKLLAIAFSSASSPIRCASCSFPRERSTCTPSRR